MAQSALIIAPHFDDEVLGCGGTIIRLRQLGADVGLIFMTDGTGSHSGHVSHQELTAQRSAEGNAAAAVMSLAPEDVTLLGLPEAQLSDFFEEGTASLLGIIQQRHPDAIFLPYRHEPLIWSTDHRQTTAITLAALRASGRSFTLYKYPIWAWYGLSWLRPSWPQGVRRCVYLKTVRPTSLDAFYGATAIITSISALCVNKNSSGMIEIQQTKIRPQRRDPLRQSYHCRKPKQWRQQQLKS
jgi:LmbE family N-acetylglucosaminyl deacetylase